MDVDEYFDLLDELEGVGWTEYSNTHQRRRVRECPCCHCGGKRNYYGLKPPDGKATANYGKTALRVRLFAICIPCNHVVEY